MRTPIKFLFFLSFIFTVINSCQKDNDFFNQDRFDLDEAQTWYENNKPEDVGLKSEILSQGKINIKPDWENIHKGKHENFRTIEIPLMSQGFFGYSTIESFNAFEETMDKRYRSSMTRLVIKKDFGCDEKVGFLMTIVPNKEFREKKNFKVFSSYYLDWQKDFSGYIIYHDLDGNYANGWKFVEGRVTKTVQRNNSDLDFHLKSTRCKDVYIFDWYEDCTDWYKQNPYSGVYEYTNTTCSAPYEVSSFSHRECDEEIIEDHGSGTSTGGYNPNQNTCSCYECSKCGGCIVYPLKSANIDCPPCSCPPANPNIDIDGYNNLTNEEKRLVRLYPIEAIKVQSNRDEAVEKTIEKFNVNGHNDKSDAFRHAYFQALNVQDIGDALTKLFSDAHEQNPDQPEIEKEMDLHNNSIGIDIGKTHDLPENSGIPLEDRVMDALNNGELRIIVNGQITPSNN